MPVIKRYSNRKLYNTEAKHYVTLDDIAGLIRKDEDVQVIDHESGSDITALVTAQVILAQERKSNGSLPKTLLHDLLHVSTDKLQQLRQVLTPHTDLNVRVDSEIERRIQNLVRLGKMEDEQAQVLLAQLLSQSTPSKSRASDDQSPARTRVSRRTYPSSRKQLERLTRHVAELNIQLDQLVAESTKKNR